MAKWQESAQGFDKIDKDAGIIYGVRVIGTQSRNRREYPADVLKANRGKYEESRVYVDHNRKASERSIRDKWGQLREIRVADDGGLIADLHFNRHHPMTPQLIEDAERFPKTFGLSHTASGDEEKRGGRNVVTSIDEVFSVDLVSTPATTNGLFESEGEMTTVGKLLESNAGKVKFAKVLLEGLKLFKEEGEDGMMDPMAAPAEAPAGASPEDQVDAAFKAAVMAVLDDETLDAAGRMAKIKAILQAQEKAETALSGEAPGSSAGDGSTSGPGGGEEEPMSEALKSLQAQVATLTEENQRMKTRDACSKLLTESGREPTDVRVSALARMPEGERKTLIESWPKDRVVPGSAPAGQGKRPAASPSVITESTDPVTEYPKDSKSFIEALR